MLELLSLSFVILFNGLLAADGAPVIIWGPNIQHKPVAALKSFDGDEFMNILREHSTADMVTFVVAEKELSVDDLSQCKSSSGDTCFKGIRKIESKLYLPSVEDPASIIEKVAELNIIEVNLLSSGNLSEPLNHRNGHYFYVNFDDDHYTDETKSAKLSRHDGMITKFYDEFLLKHNLNIMVILTGQRAAQHRRIVRDVRNRDEENTIVTNAPPSSSPIKPLKGFIWTAPQLMLYYISIGLVNSSESQWTQMNVVNVAVTTDLAERYEEGNSNNEGNDTESDRTTDSASTIIVSMSSNDEDVLAFWIIKKRNYWSASNFTWNDMPLISDRPIYAQVGFSYHCTPKIKLTYNGTTILTWKGLQIQPKFVYNEGQNMTSFSDAYDCVGFLSPVIMTGLFIAFVLLFILFVGILCLFSIKSIDRFDNPKGKTITVTFDG